MAKSKALENIKSKQRAEKEPIKKNEFEDFDAAAEDDDLPFVPDPPAIPPMPALKKEGPISKKPVKETVIEVEVMGPDPVMPEDAVPVINAEIITTELVKYVDDGNIDLSKKDEVKQSFAVFVQKADEWMVKAKEMEVTSITQTNIMKKAREARLAIRAIRLEANKVREKLKEDGLRYNNMVQGVYNIIEQKMSQIEGYLERQENFKERWDAQQKEERRVERSAEMEPFKKYVPLSVDLGALTDDDYAILLNGAKLQVQAEENKVAEQVKQRELEDVERALNRERTKQVIPYWNFLPSEIANGNIGKVPEAEWAVIVDNAISAKMLDDDRKEKLRLENERLQKQQDEQRKKQQDEQRKKDAELEKERQARLKAEAALAEQRRAEQKKEQERKAEEKRKEDERKAEEKKKAEDIAEQERLDKAAKRKERNAPDKVKLEAFMQRIKDVERPAALKTEEGEKILASVNELLTKTENYFKKQIDTL